MVTYLSLLWPKQLGRRAGHLICSGQGFQNSLINLISSLLSQQSYVQLYTDEQEQRFIWKDTRAYSGENLLLFQRILSKTFLGSRRKLRGEGGGVGLSVVSCLVVRTYTTLRQSKLRAILGFAKQVPEIFWGIDIASVDTCNATL